MILLIDIGNTHVHLGLGGKRGVVKRSNLETASIRKPAWLAGVKRLVGARRIEGVVICSVVPRVTPVVRRLVLRQWKVRCLELNHRTITGIGIDYPAPETIGPDRLANALAVRVGFGAPSVVVDFGTAVTFDVVNREGNYVGGIIAPGLEMMADYLNEKTALLPRIRIRDPHAMIGRTTEQAMLVGAVHGYRGLIRELIVGLRRELGSRRLPVVATGGYAALVAGGLPEIRSVEPLLTLEGLRLAWELSQA